MSKTSTYVLLMLPRARRSMAELPARERQRVDAAIVALQLEPRPGGAKALQGKPKGRLRIRVGDYRVIYEVRDNELVVLVIEIGHRREVYR